MPLKAFFCLRLKMKFFGLFLNRCIFLIFAFAFYTNKQTWKKQCRNKRGKTNKQTWKKQVENEMKKNGLGKEDACDRTKWRGIVKTMTIRNLANSVDGENTGSNMWYDDFTLILLAVTNKHNVTTKFYFSLKATFGRDLHLKACCSCLNQWFSTGVP